MNFFDHKDLGNHLLQLCPKVVKHPVYILATDYGMNGPGSNPGGDEIFRPSRPALGPLPASSKMGTGSFPGVKCGRGVLLTTHQSYTSTHPVGHTGPVTGPLYFIYIYIYILFDVT